MQAFEFHKTKAFLPFFWLVLAVPFSIVGEGLYSVQSFSDNESIYEGAAEDSRMDEGRVYTLNHLETLKIAISPRYIRYINWNAYGRKNGVLEKGILYTYSGYHLKKVFLSGNFNNWELIPMKRNVHGVYFVVIPVNPDSRGVIRKKFHYKFMADGIWTHDPENRYKRDDGLGGYLSEFYLEKTDIERQISVRIIEEAGIGPLKEHLVEFAIYLPSVSNLSIAGNFNNWNPEHDILEKDKDGVFRLKMRLKPGEYIYRYIADGNWILDKYNPDTKYHSMIQGLCSYLKVE